MSEIFVVVAFFASFGSVSATAMQVDACRAIFNSRSSQFETLFLHNKVPDLHLSKSVESINRRTKIKTNVSIISPAKKISVWLNHLDRVYKDLKSNQNRIQQIKNIFYKKFVILPIDVPESFYENQIRIARNQGYGAVSLTEAMRKSLANTIITDQKKSLDVWIDYFLSKDSASYPIWVKYWSLSSLVKLSKFNAATGSFGNRSHGQIAPFPELNREAFSYVVDAIIKKVNRHSLEEIKDETFLKHLEGAGFGKMYGRALQRTQIKNFDRSVTSGRWVVFKQGTDAALLFKSLEGMNTGWCTAGEATAKAQIEQGDFHVYYSNDANGNSIVPRLAIRMEKGTIAEVRGVGKDQNLDEHIAKTSILAERLDRFGSEGKMYEKKLAHMKKLTKIEDSHKNGIDLTFEELRFLYEADEPILGFGYGKDPRIAEILSERNVQNDITIVLSKVYSRDEISFTREEALKGNIKFHYGDLDLSDLKTLKVITLPLFIRGSLFLDGIKSTEDMVLPEKISHNLFMNGLTSLKGLKKPKQVGGMVHVFSIENVEEIFSLGWNQFKMQYPLPELPAVFGGNDLFPALY